MDYVGGYVIFNDLTARDIQRGEMRSGVFSFCKAIDTFCPLGPWIVTPDEIADPHDLAMQLRVNGEVRQESHSSRMSVTIPEILSNFSGLTYSAGDVLSTGHGLGRRRVQVTGGARAALPQAGRRDRGRDRGDRRAPQPRDLVAGGTRDAPATADPPLGRRVGRSRAAGAAASADAPAAARVTSAGRACPARGDRAGRMRGSRRAGA